MKFGESIQNVYSQIMDGSDQPANVNYKRSFEKNEGVSYTAGSEHVDWAHLSRTTDQLRAPVDTELTISSQEGLWLIEFGSNT
jgi:hypothetical protein